MKTFRRFWALIRLGRPHFLVGGVILYLLGVATALYSSATLNLVAVFWGQVAVTATQWMTHYANDYFDLEADRANLTPTQWSGGSRVLVEGHLSPRIALSMALLLAGVAFAVNIVLSTLIRPGAGTFVLLLLAQLLAWGYSAPPLRLHSRGLGEVTTAVTVTLLTPLVGFYLQTGAITRLPVLAALPLCGLQFAMLLAIEFPDAAGDRRVGKRTLVVRLGPVLARRLYHGTLGAVYGLLPVLWWAGLPLQVVWGIAALLPLAGWQVVRRPPDMARNTIVLLLGTALIELGVFLSLAVQNGAD